MAHSSPVQHGGGIELSPLEVDNILRWNVRGLNAPNKQREVVLLCEHENIGLAALLEIKVK